MTTAGFYNELARWYHAIFEDWDRSMSRQGSTLHELVTTEWDSTPKVIVDVASGIGTQAIPLAQRGHQVIASDIALRALARARVEAQRRAAVLRILAADMTTLPIQTAAADVVMACDNSLPHLLSEQTISAALGEFHRCVRPGGGCLVTMRDYGARPPAGTQDRWSYGTRFVGGRPHDVRQTWTWDGPHYQMLFEIVDETTGQVVLATEATYFAIRPARVLELMTEVGFARVRRVDEGYYQPILVGTRLLAA